MKLIKKALNYFAHLNMNIQEKKMDLRARYYLRKNKLISPHNGPIKVGFYINSPQVWDKLSLVYKCMKEDVDFMPQVIIDKKCGAESISELEYVDFGNQEEVIFNDGSVEIEKLNYDYFFYQRPYNMYYPPELDVNKVMKYTKVCYLPYSFCGSNVFEDLGTNSEFFRNVYLGFINIRAEREQLQKKFKYNCRKNYQQFLDLGYPALEKFLCCGDDKNLNRILWTPRWCLEEIGGGSHFFDYRDDFVDLRNYYEDIQLKFRPHPLMFENFISKGIMSKNAVIEYKKRLNDVNIKISQNALIENDFRITDILLTDFSSIIIEFFLTGKPIIYCPAKYDFNEEYSLIEEGLYIANTWEEVKKHLNNLLVGNDYLKDKRIEIIQRNFSDTKGSAERIVNYIRSDYKR